MYMYALFFLAFQSLSIHNKETASYLLRSSAAFRHPLPPIADSSELKSISTVLVWELELVRAFSHYFW